jgi:outer membrane lipoprotein-sorting protein
MDTYDREEAYEAFLVVFKEELEGKTLQQKANLFRTHYKGRGTSFDYMDKPYVLVDDNGEHIMDPNETGYLFTMPRKNLRMEGA